MSALGIEFDAVEVHQVRVIQAEAQFAAGELGIPSQRQIKTCRRLLTDIDEARRDAFGKRADCNAAAVDEHQRCVGAEAAQTDGCGAVLG